MSTTISNLTPQSFKYGDKVRVLRRDNENSQVWRDIVYGIVVGVGTRFVKIFDPEIRDGNLGTINESSELFAIESKMSRVVKW